MVEFKQIKHSGIISNPTVSGSQTRGALVYDIELEKNHYFSANGVITHNCRLKNKIQSREFNFTNGNIGVNCYGPLYA